MRDEDDITLLIKKDNGRQPERPRNGEGWWKQTSRFLSFGKTFEVDCRKLQSLNAMI